jgi:hypothetical protein
MPIDIDGWIEVRDAASGEWLGKEKLDYHLPDHHAACIFGLGKQVHLVSAPIIGPRELPTDISQEVRAEMDAYRAFEIEERSFSIAECMEFSFVSLEEVMKHDLFGALESQSNWNKVFDAMRKAQCEHNKPDDIRLIVWSCW